MKIFVYGTLKQGFRNHHYLNKATFLYQDTIQGQLYTIDDVDYPAYLTGKGTVHGEVYHIDDTTLAMLDRLEANGSLYQRELQITSHHQEEVFVYRYLGPVASRIESGIFKQQ